MSRDDRKTGDDSARARLALVLDADAAELDERSDAIAAGSASLRAAINPDELDGADHEALLALALGDVVAEYSDEELREAASLRHALDAGGDHPLAEWARGLRHAWRVPEPLAAIDHELLLALALGPQAADEVAAAANVERLEFAAEAAEIAAFGQAVQFAWQAPIGALDEADHAALLALSGLEQDGVTVAEQERAEAEQLRQALAGSGEAPLAAFATAVKCAAAPTKLDELSHQRLLKRALSGAETTTAPAAATLGRRKNSRALNRNMLLGAVVAMAAAVALFVGSLQWLETRPDASAKSPNAGSSEAGVAMVVSRSTSDLFDPMTPFPRKGGESTRMERIVASRSADLRANRFAAWGVR